MLLAEATYHPVLRPFQQSALSALKQDRHVLCVAPTGAGKSRIYEIAARTLAKRTLLISPLIALGRQQESQLRQLGLNVAVSLGGQWSSPTPQTHIWITSPEFLATPKGKSLLKSWKPDFWVVDECHCWSEWGETFRPAYRTMTDLFLQSSPPRSVWLSATFRLSALRSLEQAIDTRLKYLGGFDLPATMGLSLIRLRMPDRLPLLRRKLARQPSPGIIFAATRYATESVQRLLKHWGHPSIFYHAGMSQEERQTLERTLYTQTNTVVVATTAFGMGMNFTQFQWSILWQPLYSLEAIAQALGRCGRKAEAQSRASIFWHPEEFQTLRRLSPNTAPEVEAFLTSKRCRIHDLRTVFNTDSGAPLDATLDPPGFTTPVNSLCLRCDACLLGSQKLV